MRYQATVYRALQPYWAQMPLSGEGAAFAGGRFNPVGVAALYTSLSATGALAEYHKHFPQRPQPVTLCAYKVDCENIVEPDEHYLDCNWKLLFYNNEIPPTWTLANKLIEQGVAGIIVPSFSVNAPKHAKNLILWKWDKLRPHQILLIDDKKLIS